MTGFDRDWLALREPADHAARAGVLERLLAGRLEGPGELRIADLGCGTGSNLRHLAPRLRGRQHWTLLDADAALLATVPGELRGWAEARGDLLQEAPDGLHLAGDGLEARVEVRQADLASRPLPIGDTHLVTASALLDLVSRDWLAGLAAHCAELRAAVLFTLTYDGTIAWQPPMPLDCDIAALVNRHQRGDKGFGPALGPDAHKVAAELFRAHGYTVEEARSDWHLTPGETLLQQHLHAGWTAAASEMAPQATEAIHEWLAQRMDALEAGAGYVNVGHMDLLAVPGN
ncbi:hypothetical protein [Ferruginivarius sediminum]|uniref:Class I SAM-dependent methyltransferase n=1 Tax=Ferruginivarius sediminum TaxID=2661937 RepID=A0A369T7U6_9PROT|nr:hypothetical protein [Ferruginivarius sediminum]RDD61380.1 hypothetical protein DRB17_12935 [Ferruginivarius sediminum]